VAEGESLGVGESLGGGGGGFVDCFGVGVNDFEGDALGDADLLACASTYAWWSGVGEGDFFVAA
jgi:hypothetical protein